MYGARARASVVAGGLALLLSAGPDVGVAESPIFSGSSASVSGLEIRALSGPGLEGGGDQVDRSIWPDSGDLVIPEAYYGCGAAHLVLDFDGGTMVWKSGISRRASKGSSSGGTGCGRQRSGGDSCVFGEGATVFTAAELWDASQGLAALLSEDTLVLEAWDAEGFYVVVYEVHPGDRWDAPPVGEYDCSPDEGPVLDPAGPVDAAGPIVVRVPDVQPGLSPTLELDCGVPGISTFDGERLTFEPDHDLDWGETCNATVQWVCGTAVVDVPVKDEPLDPAMVGNAWHLELGPDTVYGVTGADALVGNLVVGTGVAIGVVDVDGRTVDLRMAPTVGGVQDLCQPTVESTGVPVSLHWAIGGVPEAAFQGPLTLSTAGGPAVLGSLDLDGAIGDPSWTLWSTSLEGSLDLAALPEACAELEALSEPCVTCTSTGLDTCTAVHFSDSLPSVGLSVVGRSEADIAADPSCP